LPGHVSMPCHKPMVLMKACIANETVASHKQIVVMQHCILSTYRCLQALNILNVTEM